MAITVKKKYCEVCGKAKPLGKAEVEGVVLNVCSDCISYGKEVEGLEWKEEKAVKIKPVKRLEIVDVLIPDYAERIKTRREETRRTQKQLAFAVSERESVISGVESRRIEPSIDLAKKLEKALNVRLVVKQEERDFPKKIFTDKKLTIGDLIELKDGQEKKNNGSN